MAKFYFLLDEIKEKIEKDFHKVAYIEFDQKIFSQWESDDYVDPYHVWVDGGEIIGVAKINGPGENEFYLNNPAKIFGGIGS